MAPGKGRGLFASRNLAKGELLIAEKAISYGKEDPEYGTKEMQYSYSNGEKTYNNGNIVDLIQNCSTLAQLKAAHAVRLSHLFDGRKEDMDLPPLDVFVKNSYKRHCIPDMS